MTFAKSNQFLLLLAVLLSGVASEAKSDDATDVSSASDKFPTAPLVDPNNAPRNSLAEVPGLSEAALEVVIDKRPFTTPSELHAAIGGLLEEDERQQVYRHMFIKVGLNSGADADYRLIPSTMPARKLAHEFEEYRPYESVQQFRREMAKYVSDEEVAYLARYVTLD